ncbi:thioredoxin domain-containing protein [Kibdelosporangium aridum]|uniref:DsbA family protein n=1 Tax=Kibdelosporangium aridum TaxID=2030 RepID=UPI0005671D0F|nr:thioredoxin domain-containing protein [Kibdelosporangium aridum]
MSNARRKRRAAARAVASARPGQSNRQTLAVTVVVLLVLAVAVIGGALWTTANKDTSVQTPISPVTSAPDSVQVTLDGDSATVLVGSRSAPTTVDVYEDYLCPACREFEEAHHGQLYEKLLSGSVQVRYHPVNLLDQRSDPPGYSLRAASAALAVAQLAPGRFLDYHHSLFAAQPEEGSSGFTNAQLIELGRQLGVPVDRLAANVASATFEGVVRRSLESASTNPTLRVPGRTFGTPTVLVNGSLVDPWSTAWLASRV